MRIGSAAKTILEFAEEEGVDLIHPRRQGRGASAAGCSATWPQSGLQPPARCSSSRRAPSSDSSVKSISWRVLYSQPRNRNLIGRGGGVKAAHANLPELKSPYVSRTSGHGLFMYVAAARIKTRRHLRQKGCLRVIRSTSRCSRTAHDPTGCSCVSPTRSCARLTEAGWIGQGFLAMASTCRVQRYPRSFLPLRRVPGSESSRQPSAEKSGGRVRTCR